MVTRVWMGVLLGVMVLSCSWAAEKQAPHPVLSFETFSEKVLAYYPQLKASQDHVEIALARQMQARSGFWPSLDFSAGYKITDDPVDVFGVLLRQERFTSEDFELNRMNSPARHRDFSLGLHAQWPLFDAMQTIGRARAARESVKAAEAEADFTRMEAWLLAQDAYLNALTLERLAATIEAVQKSSSEDIQKARDLKDKGMILGADYYSARVALGELSRTHNELVRQKKAMTALLNILMGEAVGTQWALVDRVQDGEMPLITTETLLESAWGHRPDLVALAARVKASEADLARERATGLPALSVFGSGSNNRNHISFSGGNNYTVGLKADMSLFDPSRQGRLREARVVKAKAEKDWQILKDGISRQIVEEAARYEAIRDNREILSAMREDAREAASLMEPLYREGRKSVADVTEARCAYWRAAQAYEKSVMGARMSETRLLFLTGELTDEAMKGLAQRSGL